VRTEPVIAAEAVSVRLGGRTVVADASLALRRGELALLVGPNGAGKTTLLRALAGLLPSTGRITLAGRPLAQIAPAERARLLAYLPQGHVFHWPMAVANIVALGRLAHGDPFVRRSEADEIAIVNALALTGTTPLAMRSVTTLSGGERARVALARALAADAAILIADEPTVSLDPRHQLVVMDLLRQTARRGGAVLAVVHDLGLAARFADRVLVIERGRIVADAAPQEALSPARVASVFGIEVTMVEAGERNVPYPLRPL